MSDITSTIVFYLIYYTGLSVCAMGSVIFIFWCFCKTVDWFVISSKYTVTLWEYALHRKKFKEWLKNNEP